MSTDVWNFRNYFLSFCSILLSSESVSGIRMNDGVVGGGGLNLLMCDWNQFFGGTEGGEGGLDCEDAIFAEG